MEASSSSITLDHLDLDLVADQTPSGLQLPPPVSCDDDDQSMDLEPDSHSFDVDTTQHLTFPAEMNIEQSSARPDKPMPSRREQQGQGQQAKNLLKERLYIGNLHPSVDEYTLLHVFSKFGKVAKLDFLFNKAGPMKGKPRGYAFLEYGSHEEAAKALSIAHGKLLRGRKLSVTYAQQAPLDQYPASGSKGRRQMMEVGRPTALSIIKTGLTSRHEPKTADKIAMMEAKLRQLEASKPNGGSNNYTLSSSSSSSLPPKPTSLPPNPTLPAPPASTLPHNPSLPRNPTRAAATISLPHHPSLPSKPPPPLPAHVIKALQQTQTQSTSSSSSSSATPRAQQQQQPSGHGASPYYDANASASNSSSLAHLIPQPRTHVARPKLALPSLPLPPKPQVKNNNNNNGLGVGVGVGSGGVASLPKKPHVGIVGGVPLAGVATAGGAVASGITTSSASTPSGGRLGKNKLAGVIIKPKSKGGVEKGKVPGGS